MHPYLEKNIDTDAPNGCWLWTGPKGPNGYPWCHFAGERFSARRLMFETENRNLAKKEGVTSGCGNESCVNPKHLKAGGTGLGPGHTWSTRTSVQKQTRVKHIR